MPNSENQPSPRYEKSYFKAKATARDYERRYNSPETVGMNRFMVGRRLSDYTYFAQLQELRVHQEVGTAYSKVTTIFCSCGLAVDFPLTPANEELPADALDAHGHWDHHSKSLAQVFVLDDRLVCAGCDLDEIVEFECDDDESDVESPIVDWDDVLQAHAGCGFDRFNNQN
jgi:hypothetical protein